VARGRTAAARRGNPVPLNGFRLAWNAERYSKVMEKRQPGQYLAGVMAESEGFEPSVGLPRHRFSSFTHPPRRHGKTQHFRSLEPSSERRASAGAYAFAAALPDLARTASSGMGVCIDTPVRDAAEREPGGGEWVSGEPGRALGTWCKKPHPPERWRGRSWFKDAHNANCNLRGGSQVRRISLGRREAAWSNRHVRPCRAGCSPHPRMAGRQGCAAWYRR
jgi:hypothetical protein